jgi:hypothetical protein
MILIHTIPVHCQAQIADFAKADRLTGLRFQFLIELYRVLVDLPDAVAHVE